MLLMSLVAASALVLSVAGVVPAARFGQLVVLLAAVHLLTIATQIGQAGRWRDAIRRHAWGIALLAVCAVAVAVRLPGFASDLGHTPLDIDEQRVAANVRHYFLTGEVRHRHIEQYPGVVFWLFSASSLLFFVRALMNGIVTAVNDLPLETFARAARLANIWVAAASVGMTGLVGWRISGKAAAVLGALLVAVVPLSVESTILVRNDAGMVLAVVAATYAALAYHDTAKLPWLAASGAFAGLAAGIKYTAVFALAPVLIAALSVSPLQKQVRAAVLGVLAFGLTIGASHHFIWADFPNFLSQVAAQYAFTGPGHIWSTDEPEWFYVMTLATAGPGWPTILLAAAFAIYALATRKPKLWIFISFPLIYMWFMTRRDLQVARWVFPLVPYVAVAGAAALVECLARVPSLFRSTSKTDARARLGRLTAALAIVAVLWQPLWAGAVSFSKRVSRPTHELAEAWIRDNAKPGTVVLLERGWLDLSQTQVVARRVARLSAVLDGDIEKLDGCDWIVVPEPVFGHRVLRQFGFLQKFHADRSFGGNLGPDFEVYALPDVGTTSDCGEGRLAGIVK